MTPERFRELVDQYAKCDKFGRDAIGELLAAVDSLMAENEALRNFANPLQSTDKEEAFYRMADELGWKFKDVKPVP